MSQIRATQLVSNPFKTLSKVMATSIAITFLFVSHSIAEQKQQPTVAIVIDDMGNNLANGERLIELPYPLTLAFLPERRHTLSLIDKAKANNKEIMLHSPMQNSLGIKLGKGGLTDKMSEMQIKQTLRRSFISIPYMVGLNNHMGSQLTTQNKVMNWVMETVKKYPFFFLDSRTSAKSIAAKVAIQHNIPTLRRDIFLDHFQTRKFVQKQFLKLIEVAKQNGTAIAIAHPHSVTVDYLSWALSKLDEKGISIASASAIWQIQNPGKSMQQIFSARQNHPRLAQNTQKNTAQTRY